MTASSLRVWRILPFYIIKSLVPFHSFAFFVLALAIMGPLLSPGHLLTVDSQLALNFDISGYFWGTSNGPQSVFAATYNSAPIALIHKLIGSAIPSWIVEKLWLILLLWLAGIGAYRLPYIEGWGRYYAGIFYMVNPFTYIRFVSGQWGVLGAYALTPFAIAYFLRMLEDPRFGHAAKLVFFLTLIGLLQIHGLALLLIMLSAIYIVRAIFVQGTFRKTLPVAILSGLVFLGVNMFWIVRYINASSVVENINIGELRYFAASPAIDVLSLRGFWLQGPYLDISDLIPFWWVFFTPILFVAIYGGVKMLESSTTRWLALALLATTTAGIVLAAGPGISATEPVFSYLWEKVPAYRAFRDSHKFLSLTALGYAYLGAFGIQYVLNGVSSLSGERRWLYNIGLLTMIGIPIVYTLPLFGTWGQIKSARFPDEWNQVQAILDGDQGDFNVLALPWNMYMDFPWLENRWKRLANPAPNFFSQPTISGDNLEIGITSTNSSNRISRYVEELLDRRDTISDFGNQISPLNAKYVVLFESGGSKDYGFLVDQADLEIAYEGETIKLYRNLRRTTTAYSSSELKGYATLEDYFDEPGENRLSYIYVLGSDEIPMESNQSPALDSSSAVETTKNTPVSYAVRGKDERYLVLVLPQKTTKQGWVYSEGPSLFNLDMMPVFQASSETDTIVFSRFYKLHLPLYVMALATVLFCVAAQIFRRLRRA